MQHTAGLRPRIEEAMNAQLREEFAAAYQYLAMSAYLESVPLPGAAKWMRAQAQEEVTHAMKFFQFIVDRSGRVALQALPEPRKEFASPLEVFEHALEHERRVTGEILRLYELAHAEKDYVSQPFLQDFLREQIEEEKTATSLVDMLRMAGDSGPALLLVDREMGQRSGPG